jgi:tRNA-splicing ligase RtcB (3'-phosphate/5'-hydroxy nucleic acid ligase)
MPIRHTIEDARVPVKVFTDDIDAAATAQLRNVASLPFVHHHVAAMPDVHWGLGATVGSVIPTIGAIVPAAVGVDIGCGMNALRLSLTADQLPDNLAGLRAQIERDVPVGFNGHPDGRWCEEGLARVATGLARIQAKYPAIDARWQSQLGSLGGGNHFIELCLDESDRVWIMLHSGSRGIGNRIGQFFIEQAKEEMLRRGLQPPDRDLAWLPDDSPLFHDYMAAVGWAQDYALENRRQMVRLILGALRHQVALGRLPDFALTDEAIECHQPEGPRTKGRGGLPWPLALGPCRAAAGPTYATGVSVAAREKRTALPAAPPIKTPRACDTRTWSARRTARSCGAGCPGSPARCSA